MSVNFKCRECGKVLHVSLEHAGKKSQCGGCGLSIRIPDEEKLRRMMAKAGVAPAAPEPPAPRPAEPETPAADPFAGLSTNAPANDWDDFDLSEPVEAPPSATHTNPFASPLANADYSGFGAADGGPAVYAGFAARLVAMVLDWIIIAFLFVAIMFGVGFTIGFVGAITGKDLDNLSDRLVGAILQSLWVVAIWLYYALQESSARQATVGKAALGIRVTGVNGQRISFGRATGRFFAKYLSGVMLLFGYLMAAFTERKQTLHDLLAGTLVVKA